MITIRRASLYLESEHYSYNEKTGEITFNIKHRHYKMEKKILARYGVDIDTIKTVEEYLDCIIQYRHEIHEEFTNIWIEKKPKDLEQKFAKSLILHDFEESERLQRIIERRNKLFHR